MFRIIFYLLLFAPLFGLDGSFHPKQRIVCDYEKEFLINPQTFEKCYVDGSMIYSSPQGMFLKHPDGSLEKVETLSHDCQGTYILRLNTQCPHCGKIYLGNKSPEGWNCLLHEKEIAPQVWLQP